MPPPRAPKAHAGSRDGSCDESDATIDQPCSIQTRRTRKRPAQTAGEALVDNFDSQSTLRRNNGLERASSSAADTSAQNQDRRASPYRNHERRTGQLSTQPRSDRSTRSSAFETPNQVRQRLASTQHGPSSSSGNTQSVRQPLAPRSAQITRPNTESGLTADLTSQNADWRPSLMVQTSNLPVHSASSVYIDGDAASSAAASIYAATPASSNSSPHPAHDLVNALTEASRARSTSLHSQPSSIHSIGASMVRTNSNMSPPRPTRALPRRRASARTQNRPLLSSTNSSSSQHAARSRSTSTSNVLGSSNSTANILSSGQHNRQNSITGCAPLGGGFDPSYNLPSGMSTPRTPLAEIPLWLADMRSESRRSSTSSSSFMDREDFMNASRSVSSRHARTFSTSSSGPPSPGLTRNGSVSPVVPFRRSLRGRRPRQSDENASISPSPSYFGEFDVIPSTSSTSGRGDMTPYDDSLGLNAGLPSSMLVPGTVSPSTPSVHVTTASPAMSTRSRTLNRSGSVRNRRMTNPLNTPVSAAMAASTSEAGGLRARQLHAVLNVTRSAVNQGRQPHNDELRSASLFERRAATAANAVTTAAPNAAVRVASRPGSRTSSPARGTRASRRRSTVAEGQSSLTAEDISLAPRPANLPPLHIPSVDLGPTAGLMLLHVPTLPTLDGVTSSAVSGSPSDVVAVAVADRQLSSQMDPLSPSAFSEMTSLTQGSTASESTNSASGMPATPSFWSSTLDPFAQAVTQDGALVGAGGSSQACQGDGALANDGADASSSRVLRQTASQRKNPAVHRDTSEDEGALGVQLRPRP